MSFTTSVIVPQNGVSYEPQLAELRVIDSLAPSVKTSTFSDKLLKYSIAIALVLIGVAVFYFLAVFSPSREQVKVDLEIARFQAEQEAVLRNQLLLASCLNQAEVQWLSVASLYENMFKDQRETGATLMAAQKTMSQAVKENDGQLQMNKDNCFKQFPQSPSGITTGPAQLQ